MKKVYGVVVATVFSVAAPVVIVSAQESLPANSENKVGEAVAAGTLVFGADYLENLVIQDMGLYGELKVPIVGDPVCTQFVDPCPQVSSTSVHGAAADLLKLSTSKGTKWEVRFDDAKNDSGQSMQIRSNNKKALRVVQLNEPWGVEVKSPKPKEWQVIMSPDDPSKTPVTESGGGCWVEVTCPGSSKE